MSLLTLILSIALGATYLGAGTLKKLLTPRAASRWPTRGWAGPRTTRTGR